MWAGLKSWARTCKREVRALGLAMRHPRTPWYARAWVACVVAYALSPIDLIPDFIPIVGYLDDLILLPIGVWIALRLIPASVMIECRRQAEREMELGVSLGRAGAAAIILLWLAVAVVIARLLCLWLR